MKKILVLGGTQFIGRNLVERLSQQEDLDLTIFNRQRTHSSLFPDVKRLRGDRETTDISNIHRDEWDYVIDLSCYYPDSLESTLKQLRKTPEKYIFISTCSVYDNANNLNELRNEDAEILGCTESERTDRHPESYGNRKAECERILADSGIPHVILRPALVFGPHDHTDRLYYWLYQVMKNDPILLPDRGERSFSLTYVKDLVEVVIRLLEHDTPRTVYNTISKPKGSIQSIVKSAQEYFGNQPRVLNAEPAFLRRNGIAQWTDMPLWIDGDHFTYSNERLLSDLQFEAQRFKDSVEESLHYYSRLNWPVPAYGMNESERKNLLLKLVA